MLEGKKIQPAGTGDIYFIFQGEAHLIPTMGVYNNFWDNVGFDPCEALPVPSLYLPTNPIIAIGSDFGPNACLIRDNSDGAIYVFDGIRAWHIPNMATFGFYNFSLNHFKSTNDGSFNWQQIVSLGVGILSSVF